MKILVLSDTHLGLRFEEKKFKLLKSLIKSVNKVVINGDFWEGYKINFEQFINSHWKLLFPLLKSKKTTYLFGNHDKKLYSNEKTSLFSDLQAHQYKMKLNGNVLVFEHGNRLCSLFDETHPKFYEIIKKTNILGRLHEMMVRKFGSKILKLLFSSQNEIIKAKIKKELKNGEIFVCGHTHAAEFDIKNNFLNSGIIMHGLAQYVLIDGKKIYPKEEWYD